MSISSMMMKRRGALWPRCSSRMHGQVKTYELAQDFLADYHGERPACLVTDLRMRGMSGVELLEELRKQKFTLSVLVMTAYPDTRSTVRAMRGGAINLIEKALATLKNCGTRSNKACVKTATGINKSKWDKTRGHASKRSTVARWKC